MDTAIFLIQCADKRGIVAKISDLVFRYEGNIIQSDQYTTDWQNGSFFMRIEFCFDPEFVSREHLETELGILSRSLQAQSKIRYRSTLMKMGILVSKQDHCLADILYRWKSRELLVEIPFVASNHEDARELVEQYHIPFYHIPAASNDKGVQEQFLINLAKDKTDFLVLARYMQILTETFLSSYQKEIVNIHHSFLPSFKGANPYRQAYERGVKVIGATAHYVTGDLDEGPIIEQMVESVSHKDNVEALVRKGRNLEKLALANAIRAHLEHRVIRFHNKTIVFD